MWKTATKFRSPHRIVRSLQADNATNDVVGLSGIGKCTMARRGSGAALEEGG